jgi:hypothetical protein
MRSHELVKLRGGELDGQEVGVSLLELAVELRIAHVDRSGEKPRMCEHFYTVVGADDRYVYADFITTQRFEILAMPEAAR